MKLTIGSFAPVIVLAIAVSTHRAGAQTASQAKAAQQPSAPQSQAAENHAAAMQADAPGPAHQLLAKRAGEYTTVLRFWMAPGAQPAESSGTATITVTLEGRFLREEDSGTMMGMPY